MNIKTIFSFVVLSAFLATSSFAQAPADQTSAKTIRDRIIAASSCAELREIRDDLQLVREEACRIKEDLKRANEILATNTSITDALLTTTIILGVGTVSLTVSSRLLGGSSAAARAFQRHVLSTNALRKVEDVGVLTAIGGLYTSGFTLISLGSMVSAKQSVKELSEKLKLVDEKVLLIDEILQHKAKHMRCVLGN